MHFMSRFRHQPKIVRDSLAQGLALVCLLMMSGFAIAGPNGVIAWSENQRLLLERQSEVESLAGERARLRNRVNLLNPSHADPDLSGELLRSRLNVAHPDEMVMLLD